MRDSRVARFGKGYKVADRMAVGKILPHRLCLPGERFRLTCDANAGAVRVSVFDRDGKRIGVSRPMKGGLRIDAAVEWGDDVDFQKHIATPVQLEIELTGDAKFYGLGFDDVFWD